MREGVVLDDKHLMTAQGRPGVECGMSTHLGPPAGLSCRHTLL